MNGAERPVAAERGDHAFDLPPVAETRDVPVVTAALGAERRLDRRFLAKAIDEVRSVGKNMAAVDEESVHAPAIDNGRFGTADKVRQPPVDHGAVAFAARLCHGRAMQGSSTRAGGCFLTLFLILGFFFGLSIRNPLKGVLIGLGVGAVLAIAVWLIDLRRRGS